MPASRSPSMSPSGSGWSVGRPRERLTAGAPAGLVHLAVIVGYTARSVLRRCFPVLFLDCNLSQMQRVSVFLAAALQRTRKNTIHGPCNGASHPPRGLSPHQGTHFSWSSPPRCFRDLAAFATFFDGMASRASARDFTKPAARPPSQASSASGSVARKTRHSTSPAPRRASTSSVASNGSAKRSRDRMKSENQDDDEDGDEDEGEVRAAACLCSASFNAF